MNKFVLFSALACSVFICNASFADREGCTMTKSGNHKVCAEVNVGGGYEQNKCLSGTYAQKTIMHYAEGSKKDECTINQNKLWYSKDHACSPTNAPANSGYCIEQGTYTNEYCTLDSTDGATGTACDCSNKEKKTSTQTITSCAAKYCNNGYLLYTTNKNNRRERKIVDATIPALKDEMLKEKVGSQGLCRSRNALKSVCEKSCACDKGEKCVLNEVTIEIYGRNVPAYIGEEMCVCVADNNGGGNGSGGNNGGGNGNLPGDENCEECVYTLKVDVKCANGKTFKKNEQIKVTKDEAEKLRWTEAKKKLDAASSDAVIENLLKEIEGYDTLIEKICGKKNSTVTVPTGSTDAEVAAAKKTLSAFFETTKQNRNVWRDKDGNFNTARLASDLTAGVVLGTVGGVVSGVVIKKKQVEKGFDALHCTVGGQTVADWGDTFTVGLR